MFSISTINLISHQVLLVMGVFDEEREAGTIISFSLLARLGRVNNRREGGADLLVLFGVFLCAIWTRRGKGKRRTG